MKLNSGDKILKIKNKNEILKILKEKNITPWETNWNKFNDIILIDINGIMCEYLSKYTQDKGTELMWIELENKENLDFNDRKRLLSIRWNYEKGMWY